MAKRNGTREGNKLPSTGIATHITSTSNATGAVICMRLAAACLPNKKKLVEGRRGGGCAGQQHRAAGRADVALVEVDANGKAVWVYPMGTALDDRVLSVVVDASDHIFASYVETQNTTGDASDLRVVKLSR